jgi:hypothetical protein
MTFVAVLNEPELQSNPVHRIPYEPGPELGKFGGILGIGR